MLYKNIAKVSVEKFNWRAFFRKAKKNLWNTALRTRVAIFLQISALPFTSTLTSKYLRET